MRGTSERPSGGGLDQAQISLQESPWRILVGLDVRERVQLGEAKVAQPGLGLAIYLVVSPKERQFGLGAAQRLCHLLLAERLLKDWCRRHAEDGVPCAERTRRAVSG